MKAWHLRAEKISQFIGCTIEISFGIIFKETDFFQETYLATVFQTFS